jgi:4a-hydroxytetrahydrobiopterin dehydratase
MLRTNIICLDFRPARCFINSQMERLSKQYKFKDFSRAMAFINDVARVAEARDHHPDILVQYNLVTLTFYTHTENAVTEKDVRLAAEIDDLAKNKTLV